jgi:serine/threonine protein kinase
VLSKLGKYEIRRELGKGAMGVVYEGFDPFIERTVAIKTIRKSLIDPAEAVEALGRFRREAQAAGRLTHPSIVAVYEYGEDGDIAFIAMEFVVGRELKTFFGKGERFPLADALHIMLQLLDALAYSHECGVVHRDIKPSNIVITGKNQVKVVDFGIARIESSDLTQVGMILGTPAYMSPEQFKGATADSRSDIYSSGVIFYHMLTGERPFVANNPSALMHKVLSEEPRPPSEFDPGISKALEAVVRKAMAKLPEDRFQTAAEFREALLAADSRAAEEAATDAEDVTQTLLITPQKGRTAPLLEFDLTTLNTNIEKQLDEARQSAAASPPPSAAPPAAIASPGFSNAPLPRKPDITQESNLLADLVREATVNQEAQQFLAQTTSQPPIYDRYTRAKHLHETLEKVSVFFNALSLQLKNVEPAIARSYPFGRRAVYANLACKSAYADSRRRDIYDAVFLDYVMFGLRLSAPAPILITRPRDMLDDLKDKLDKYKINALDDVDGLARGGKPDEWVEIRLAPEFPVQLQFKGNYDENRIDVLSLNLEAFGYNAFRLGVEDVTPELLDNIGFFLLGRTDQLPAALQRVSETKNSANKK